VLSADSSRSWHRDTNRAEPGNGVAMRSTAAIFIFRDQTATGSRSSSSSHGSSLEDLAGLRVAEPPPASFPKNLLRALRKTLRPSTPARRPYTTWRAVWSLVGLSRSPHPFDPHLASGPQPNARTYPLPAGVISHPQKVLFPEDGITKGELAAYYERVAPLMLPHMSRRPVTMERFPSGIGQPGFLQKSVSRGFPEWLERVEVPKKGGSVHYALVDDTRSLLWLANQN
jgi:hypothetical protein